MSNLAGLRNTLGLLWLLACLLAFSFTCDSSRAEASSLQVKGLVIARSSLPNPKTSEYKDCLFTAAIQVRNRSLDSSLPERLIVCFWGFQNRQLTKESTFQAGDVLLMNLTAFEDMPKPFQQLQQIDEIDDLSLPYFAAHDVTILSTNTATLPLHVYSPPPAELPVYDLPQLPVDRAVAQSRAETIKALLGKIRAMRDRHDGWSNWQQKTAALRASLATQPRDHRGQWLFHNDLVYCPAEDPDDSWILQETESYNRMLESLQNLKNEFARLGTDLIVVPFPLHNRVAACTFLESQPDNGVLYPMRLKVMHDLLALDIEVIDLAPTLTRLIGKHPNIFHYDVGDKHPGLPAIQASASAISERLERYAFTPPPRQYTLKASEYGDPSRDTRFPSMSKYPCEQIVDSNQEGLSLPDTSPILLLGDSFLDTPERYGCPHANLPHRIAFETGIAPSLFKRTGTGNQIQRSLARLPNIDYLFGRKVAIYVFDGTSMYRSTSTWESLAFLDASAKQTDIATRYAKAKTVIHLTGLKAYRNILFDPPISDEQYLPYKVIVPSSTLTRRMTIPSISLIDGERYVARIRVGSVASGRITLLIHGHTAAEATLHPGINELTLPFSATSIEGWSGIVIPPDQPHQAYYDIEIRQEQH